MRATSGGRNLPGAEEEKVAFALQQLEVVRVESTGGAGSVVAVEHLKQLRQRLLEAGDALALLELACLLQRWIRAGGLLEQLEKKDEEEEGEGEGWGEPEAPSRFGHLAAACCSN